MADAALNLAMSGFFPALVKGLHVVASGAEFGRGGDFDGGN
jgi:hypothetical protein